MCELMAMSFNQAVRPNISFRGFRQRSKKNPHGWGIAFYPDESAQVIKEPIKANESQLSKSLLKYKVVQSQIFIAHVRLTSVGERSHKNTHPFCRELNGKDYVFAHNGTIFNYQSLELGRFKPIGDTDSEYIFCHLLKDIEERRIDEWKKEDFDWLTSELEEINKYGAFNCIFSDGTYLFCYYDKRGHKGLSFVQRKAPYKNIHLLDLDWDVNLRGEKDYDQTGYIIATSKLTNESWKNFECGELIVFKDGKMIYSNKRDISTKKSEDDAITSMEKKILQVIRNSPHRLSLWEIEEILGVEITEFKCSLNSLLNKGYIRQDSRDRVKWYNDGATFYTEPTKRGEINDLISDI
ncbi:MAG: class II glutamine amidotransferase [Promethearchaeota archaeon]